MSIFMRFAKLLSAVCSVTALGWGGYEILRPAYDGDAGIAKGSAYAPIRDQTLSFDLWYPTDGGGKAVTVGGNGVFFGTQAGRNALVRDGIFPLVILSHGAGGTAGPSA